MNAGILLNVEFFKVLSSIFRVPPVSTGGIFPLGEPCEIEAGEGEVAAGEKTQAGVGAAAPVEAEDRALRRDRDVGLHAGAGFEDFVRTPRFRFIIAEFDREILAVAVLARSLLAIGAG